MSSPKWTKEQQAVIDSRNSNLLVAAAAGSGKTAVLVERIIQMIIDTKNPIDIDKLLVVTFTNAAASEMRERIGDAIAKEIDKNPENKHLQNQLVLLNKASITTIHSFCLEVIKSNFHKINLDPNFRIGDQTECTILKQEVIEEVFEGLYEQRDMDFLNLVDCYAEKRGDSNLQGIILSIYTFAMASPYPSKWLDESAELFNIDDSFDFSTSLWAKAILDTVRIEIGGIELSMRKAVSEVETIEELDTFTEKLKIEYAGIKSILEACDYSWQEVYEKVATMEFESYTKGVKRLSKDTPNYIKEAKDKAKGIRDKAKKSLEGIRDATFHKETKYIKEEIKYLYSIVKAISDTVKRFDEAYSEKKKEKGIIDFNDIEHFALKILTEVDEEGKEQPSDVALGYRDKFYEIFIDEYQDSNLVQEVLLSTIAKIETPNRFMVGDVKQSIYRFRQAKPEIFLKKYNDYSTKEGDLYRKIMLYKNFRSREEVVDSANYIFENIMSQNIGEIEYTEKERLNLGAIFKENTEEDAIVGGPTEIHVIQKSIKEDENENNDNKDLDKENQEEIDNIQLEARMVGKIIKELMNPKEDGKIQKVYDKRIDAYRPVDFKDIVILLRATSSWAPVFADELMNMDIPTYADIGIGYFDTLEIKTIMALLQAIDNPMQDIPLLAVLRSPIFGFIPEDFIEIRTGNKEGSFYEAIETFIESENDIEKRNKCENFVKKLAKYKEKSLYMSTDEFLWYLYMDTGYYAYVGALPAGSQRQANLKILFERAKQFEETSFKGIFNFINFISKLRKSNTDMGSAKTLGENANVVRIMSIHKSKGLEFPVVICSAMGKNFNTQDFKKDILYHHKLGYGPQLVDYDRKISYPSIAKEALKTKINIENLSEEMRVLYVAFTRPKEKLIITGSTKDLETSINKWSSAIDDSLIIPQYEVLKGKNFLDWIMPCVLKHKDFDNIRQNMNIDLNGVDDHNSKWKGKLWYKEDIILEEKDNVEEVNATDLLIDIENNLENTEISEYIKNRLNHKYPYTFSTTKPGSISVTEIKKIENQYEEVESQPLFEERQLTLKKPLFMQEKDTRDKMTGAEIGTIMHLVMQVIDLEKVNRLDDIKVQLEAMVKNSVITQKQAQVINPYKIYNFFKSNLGKRMLKASFKKREQTIYAQIKMKDVYKNEEEIINDELDRYSEDSLMLRGIIDAYFEENDEIVLVDYKTDFVTEENEAEVIDRYKKQLDLYARSLENLTGKVVKEKYIYLFGIEKEVKYEE